jgi:hypothetical protein
MDISVFRQVLPVLGSGTFDILTENSWNSSTVMEDDFGYWDSVNDSILLPADWHRITVSVASQDGDFPVPGTATYAFKIGRQNNGSFQWGFEERRITGIAAPKGVFHSAVKFPVQDHLAVGVMQTTGSAKDMVVDVQIFN